MNNVSPLPSSHEFARDSPNFATGKTLKLEGRQRAGMQLAARVPRDLAAALDAVGNLPLPGRPYAFSSGAQPRVLLRTGGGVLGEAGAERGPVAGAPPRPAS